MSEQAKRDHDSGSDNPGDSPGDTSGKRARRQSEAPDQVNAEDSNDNQEEVSIQRSRIPLESRQSLEQWISNNPRWRDTLTQITDDQGRRLFS